MFGVVRESRAVEEFVERHWDVLIAPGADVQHRAQEIVEHVLVSVAVLFSGRNQVPNESIRSAVGFRSRCSYIACHV